MPRRQQPSDRRGRVARITGASDESVFLRIPDTENGSETTSGLVDDDAPKGYTHYEDRYVLFVDILGFTELIRQSAIKGAQQDGHDSVAAIFQALDWQFDDMTPGTDGVLDDLLATLDLGPASDDLLKVHTFSDFVVASCPANPQGLATCLFVAWTISRRWLASRFLCRGGIARGQVLHRTEDKKPPMVFGPAFIDAYKLESQVADLPRIVLSQHVRKECDHLAVVDDKLGQFVKRMVRRCTDGPHCVDVFSHLRPNGLFFSRDHMEEARQFQDSLAHHLDRSADNPGWFRKTKWLSERFHDAVQNTLYADLGRSIT